MWPPNNRDVPPSAPQPLHKLSTPVPALPPTPPPAPHPLCRPGSSSPSPPPQSNRVPLTDDPGMVSFQGNLTSLLTTRDLRDMLRPSRAGDNFILQRFVRCRGPNAFINRCVWRRDRPPLVWHITNNVRARRGGGKRQWMGSWWGGRGSGWSHCGELRVRHIVALGMERLLRPQAICSGPMRASTDPGPRCAGGGAGRLQVAFDNEASKPEDRMCTRPASLMSCSIHPVEGGLEPHATLSRPHPLPPTPTPVMNHHALYRRPYIVRSRTSPRRRPHGSLSSLSHGPWVCGGCAQGGEARRCTRCPQRSRGFSGPSSGRL